MHLRSARLRSSEMDARVKGCVGISAGEDQAVAQQLLLHAVAGSAPRRDEVVAAAHEIPESLLLWRRRLDEAERAGAVEREQLLGVAAVGLHAIAGLDGYERRGDEVTGDADRGEQAQRVIAARPRLVADGQPIGPAEALDERAQSALRVGDLLEPRLARARIIRTRCAHDR